MRLFQGLEHDADAASLEFDVREALSRWIELVLAGRFADALALLLPNTRPGSEFEHEYGDRWTDGLLERAIRSYGTMLDLKADGSEEFALCRIAATGRAMFDASLHADFGPYRMDGVRYRAEVMADLPEQRGDECWSSDLTARFRLAPVSAGRLALLLDDIHVL